ncbi:hypothetical protein [Streptomyces litmocidini]|uniref:Uncharacterized protein n=1 Tax=Streptomyces litmocidini TaxID=67318 RepID=A0ABW7U6V5_9ACTN
MLRAEECTAATAFPDTCRRYGSERDRALTAGDAVPCTVARPRGLAASHPSRRRIRTKVRVVGFEFQGRWQYVATCPCGRQYARRDADRAFLVTIAVAGGGLKKGAR